MKLNQVNTLKNSTLYNNIKTKKKSDSFSKMLNDLGVEGTESSENDEEKQKKKLKNAATEFESYFLNMMLKSMKQTIVPGIEKSNAQKTFEEMFDQEVCNKVAKAGGIGFGNMIFKTLDNN